MGTKTWAGLTVLLCLCTASLAVADDWSVVPSISQKSEFNSNINLTYNPVSDYIFSLQPAVDFNRTTATSQLQGHLGLNGRHFITQSQLDHVDQNVRINGSWQATPKLNLAVNSSYIVDTTLLQELLASGLVIGNSPRTSILANPGVTYNLTERLSSTVNYNFSRILYQAPQYTDYTTHQVGLSFNYLLKNEKTTLTNSNIVRAYLYPNDNTYKTLGIYLGGNHRFREDWDFNLLAGLNINNSSFNTQVLDLSQYPYFIQVKQQRIEQTKATPFFNMSTTRRWTKFNLTGGFTRDQSASANNYVTNFTRLYASMGYTFTERLSGSLGGSFSVSSQASGNTNADYNYYDVNANLAYKITEKLSVSPGYRYVQSDNLTNSTTGNQNAHGHNGWLMFSYSYPIHYQK
jgi:hypothetical protein